MNGLERLRETLGGVTADVIADDNLAIHFCSYFEDYSGDVDDCGWTEKAVSGCDAMLDAIHQHYAPTLAALEAHADKAEGLLAEAVEALREIADASAEETDKDWYDGYGDYANYRVRSDSGAYWVENVDSSNSGDVHSHGFHQGLHSAAVIARAILAKIKEAKNG